MRAYLILSLCLVVAAGPAFAGEQSSKDAENKTGQVQKKTQGSGKKATLTTSRQKNGYSIGFSQGYSLIRSLGAQSVEADVESVRRGFVDALTGAAPALSEQEMRTILSELQKDLDAKRKEAMKKEKEKMKVQGEQNKKEGDAFLKENRKKEGVKELPDGLQYKILAEGTGKKPVATDRVTVNYKGTLINGTEFDSSYKHGQPATFVLNQVIKGWTEGLQLIRESGKIQLFIPSQLGYGEQGGGPIGPNSTLIFEVELLSVQSTAGESGADGKATVK